MPTNTLAGNKITQSTQKYLDIAEIREDTVILKDGSLRAVVLVSSINFALKSDDEQQALISGYMDFVNSFEFTFQIVVQSRKLDIEGYVRALQEQRKQLKNDLLKTQITAYLEYITELIEIGQIMTKRFFVIIPYDPSTKKGKKFSTRLIETFSPGKVIKLQRKVFLEYKSELDLRVGHVIGSLSSMGLSSVQLDTQGLIELYYDVYNPKTAMNQPLADLNELRVEQTM